MKLTMDEISTYLDEVEEELNFRCTPERRKELENKQIELYQKFRELYNNSDMFANMREAHTLKLEEMEMENNAT